MALMFQVGKIIAKTNFLKSVCFPVCSINLLHASSYFFSDSERPQDSMIFFIFL